MAVPYDHRASSQDSEFGNIRDSFYILTTMNQYSVKSVVSLKTEAEGLLRIVLFSKDLRLAGTDVTLRKKRQKLAQSLRKRRRRGVVPVFISTMWFLFSLAISVQAAFGLIGENATAHDLALGLLLGWLPILILCSIVDRNPAAADDVRDQINDLIDKVCASLKDETIVNEFIESFCTSPEASELKHRVEKIRGQVEFLENNFLTSFAGQGRVRWHYGAAHPILSDIENCYIAQHGRDWLRNEEEARTKLVLGSIDRGLFWFDFRELWQISNAVIVVVGTCMGAFALSYFTPTVGLGCRSLGYLIFVINSFALLVLEFLIWWITAEEREEFRTHTISRKFTIVRLEEHGSTFKRWFLGCRDGTEDFLLGFLPKMATVFSPKRTKRREKIRDHLEHAFSKSHDYTIRQWTHRLFFIPYEVINAVWLVYIVLAQTFGSYSNCKCQSSIYGFGGGYIDLTQAVYSHNQWLKWYWSVGTSLSIGIMGVGLGYVVLEVRHARVHFVRSLILSQWCLQSHISTESFTHSLNGLQRTRTFRGYTHWIRYPAGQAVIFINSLRNIIFRSKSRQKTLVWTKNVTFKAKPGPMGRRDHEDNNVRYGGDGSPDFRGYEMYSPPLPTYASGPSKGSDDVPLIVTHLAHGEDRGLYAEAYDPDQHSYRSPSMRSGYTGYTGYESVAGGESAYDMEVLEGFPLNGVMSSPVFEMDRAGSGSGSDSVGDTDGGSVKGKERVTK
jgi:hypothetical protein